VHARIRNTDPATFVEEGKGSCTRAEAEGDLYVWINALCS